MNRAEKARYKKYLYAALRLLLVVGLLAFLSMKGLISVKSTRAAFYHWHLLAIAVVIMGINTVFASVRLHWLLQAQKISLSWARTFELTLVGGFFNIALPGSVSGDLVKAYYIGEDASGKRARSLGSVLFDRIAGLSGLIFLSGIALFIGWMSVGSASAPSAGNLAILRPWVAIVVLGMVAFFSYIFLVREHHDPLLRLMTKLESRLPLLRPVTTTYKTVRGFHQHKRTVVNALALSTGIHTVVGCAIICIALALGQSHLSPFGIFTVFPLGLLATALPVAPAGVGVGHAAFAYFFRLIGSERGADIFTLFALVQVFWGAVGGIIYLRFRSHGKFETSVTPAEIGQPEVQT